MENGGFDSCNSCKRLFLHSRLHLIHALHESKVPVVSGIEFIRSKLSNLSVHVSGGSAELTLCQPGSCLLHVLRGSPGAVPPCTTSVPRALFEISHHRCSAAFSSSGHRSASLTPGYPGRVRDAAPMKPAGRYMYLLQALSGAERLMTEGDAYGWSPVCTGLRQCWVGRSGAGERLLGETLSLIHRQAGQQIRSRVNGRVGSFAGGLEGVKQRISRTLNLMRKYCIRWVN